MTATVFQFSEVEPDMHLKLIEYHIVGKMSLLQNGFVAKVQSQSISIMIKY